MGYSVKDILSDVVLSAVACASDMGRKRLLSDATRARSAWAGSLASVRTEPEKICAALWQELCWRIGKVRKEAPNQQMGICLWKLVQQFESDERLFRPGNIDLNSLSESSLRAEILLADTRSRQLKDLEKYISDVASSLAECLLPIMKRLPASLSPNPDDGDPGIVQLSVFDIIKDPENAIEEIQKYVYSYKDDLLIFSSLKSKLASNESWQKNNEKPGETSIREHIDRALGRGPLLPFFFIRGPFGINYHRRFSHTHVIGATGCGKTQLLLSLIYKDILAAGEGRCGCMIIDSQGDIINTIVNLSKFDPDVGQSLSERLIYLDPTDVEYPLQLNLFDVDLKRIQRVSDPALRETMMNNVLSLFEDIFSAIGGELTMYMENLYRYCTTLLLNIEGANIMTFLDLLQEGERFRPHFQKLDPMTRRYFETEFFSKKYTPRKEELASRLWNILSNRSFQLMFSAKRNRLDLFSAMNEGKIVLLPTAKSMFQEARCTLLGRFYIAMLLNATFMRATIPENKRLPFFVYIDECADYLNDHLISLMSQARKYNVGVTIAHQHLSQLSAISHNLLSSVITNTATKIVGKLDISDAKYMAERIQCEPQDITSLRKVERHYAELLYYSNDLTRQAVKFEVPLGMVNKKPRMSKESFMRLREISREKFCEHILKRELPEQVRTFSPEDLPELK